MIFKKKSRKINSKEVGLEMGLMVFKFFLKTEYLHYGYFNNGLRADVANLKKAQEDYAEMLFNYIPHGVKTILDVGCGSGKTAQQLIERGYEVDCVSPGHLLTAYAKKLVGDTANFYQCKFEDIPKNKKYDLVLFSESFQYIPMNKSIPNALELLNEGGYIIICDFFKNDDPERKCKLGGGHPFCQWLEYKESFPIKTLVEKDITAETALTIDIVNQLNKEVVEPVWNSTWALMEDRFPYIVKFARMIYRKRLDKMVDKHFTNQRTGENFKKYKKYMLYLFQTESRCIN